MAVPPACKSMNTTLLGRQVQAFLFFGDSAHFWSQAKRFLLAFQADLCCCSVSANSPCWNNQAGKEVAERERHHKRLMEKQMPLEEVLAFSPAQIHRCFLALGYCWRGLVFHHSFIRGNLPFLLGQKHSHGHGRGGTPCISLPISAEQLLFSSLRPSSHSCFNQWQLGLFQGSPHYSVPLCRGRSQQYTSMAGKTSDFQFINSSFYFGKRSPCMSFWVCLWCSNTLTCQQHLCPHLFAKGYLQKSLLPPCSPVLWGSNL